MRRISKADMASRALDPPSRPMKPPGPIRSHDPPAGPTRAACARRWSSYPRWWARPAGRASSRATGGGCARPIRRRRGPRIDCVRGPRAGGPPGGARRDGLNGALEPAPVRWDGRSEGRRRGAARRVGLAEGGRWHGAQRRFRGVRRVDGRPWGPQIISRRQVAQRVSRVSEGMSARPWPGLASWMTMKSAQHGSG